MKRLHTTGIAALCFCLLLCACNPQAPVPATDSAVSSAQNSTAAEFIESTTKEQTESLSGQTQSNNQTNKQTSGDSASVSATVSTAAATTTTQAPTKTQTDSAVRIAIPEGFSFMQIARRLEANGVCTAQAFYNAAQSYQVQSFTVPTDSNRCFRMEGYLYPATYTLEKNQDPVSVLREMLNAYAAYSGMPDEKTLILASIIQQEARSEKHMKLVSSVFHNRLKAGMKLDADPTRDYVNDYITGNTLVKNQEKYAPLYNTYRDTMNGKLPAGPICSPGKTAIEAAKNPAESNYYYFYFGMDNDNHYSETLDEHTAKMEVIPVQGRSQD